MANEPEPNGWELLRGLKEVKESLDTLGSGMVSQALFTTVVSRVDKLEADQTEQRKTKAQQWFAIGLSFLGMVGTVVTGVILFSIKGA